MRSGLDPEVLPLSWPVEQRFDHALVPGVDARVRDLGHLDDLDLRVRVLQHPLQVALPVGLDDALRKLGELRRECGIHGGLPVATRCDLAHHLAGGLDPLLHRRPG